MKPRRLSAVPGFAFLLVAIVSGCRESAPPPDVASLSADPETRIVRYLESRVKPGEEVRVSDLYNNVFKTPEERKVLDRLFNSFFKIPLSVVQFQTSTGRIPTLAELSDQFGFTVPGEMNVVLKVMESDPRVPQFLERDSRTGEIVRVDAEAIRSHPQFGRLLERSVAGWAGKRAPRFSIQSFSGQPLSSADVSAGPHAIYFWFSQCPPCMETSPLLVDLHEQYASRGFRIVAVNADHVLGLKYTDKDRETYLAKAGIKFPNGHLTEEMQQSFGGVSLYPTFFFVDSDGVVVRHMVNFQQKPVLEAAIREAMGENQPK
jgi:thiol-disulfide isomerase/thioredoxin